MFSISSLYNFFKLSDELSQNLPNLLSESSILSKNILDGMHLTRFAGKGESFWQFREYQHGDDVTNIDWRKSSSSKKIFVREKEKEVFNNVYIYIDKSKSMHYSSQKKIKSKLYNAVLLSLTLCRLFSKSREEVFIFNNKNIPINCSRNINNFNTSFLIQLNDSLPKLEHIKANSLFIMYSDFLYEIEGLSKFIKNLKKKNVTGYLVQLVDPKELKFDFEGYNQLIDMETGDKVIFSNNHSLSQNYYKNFEKLRKDLRKLCALSNWYFMFHNTVSKPINVLLEITKNIIINNKKN